MSWIDDPLAARDHTSASLKLSVGMEKEDAAPIEEWLRNLRDGTCDNARLIPLLEQVAERRFWYFDDNGAGGMPHVTGGPVSFQAEAREAIENIRENCELKSPSPIASSLKSLDTNDVKAAVEQLADGDSSDETLIPILAKIARKDSYGVYASDRLGEMARRAIQRIRENMQVAGIASTACSQCGTIFDFASATMARDGPPAIMALRRHELGSDNDLFECLPCGALFHWREERWRGPRDEKTLTPFRKAHAGVLREILHRAGRPVEDAAALVERLLALPYAAWLLVAVHLRTRDRQLARQLVPGLIDATARGKDWLADFLKDFVSTPEDAVFVLRALEGRTLSTALEGLRAHARIVGCSICSSLNADPPPQVRGDALPPNLALLKQLGASERNDLWECPECASLFHWNSENGIGGGVRRTTGPLADAVRKCVHRTGAIDGRAIEMVFGSGREWQQLLLEHGMRHDPDLVVQLIPHMVSSLARDPQPWLHDAMCEVAQDPFGAAAVRAATARIARPNSLIKSLAAHARET